MYQSLSAKCATDALLLVFPVRFPSMLHGKLPYIKNVSQKKKKEKTRRPGLKTKVEKTNEIEAVVQTHRKKFC